MTKWEIFVVLLVIVAICVVVNSAPKYVQYRKVRLRFNPDGHKHLCPLTDWDFVTKRVLLIVLVGMGLVLLSRVKK